MSLQIQTTGKRPDFIDSPYFYVDNEGWHLKDGAPAVVKKEFNTHMKMQYELENAPKEKEGGQYIGKEKRAK